MRKAEVLGNAFEIGFKIALLESLEVTKTFFPVKDFNQELEDLKKQAEKLPLEHSAFGIERMIKVGKICAESVLEEERINGETAVNRITSTELPEAGHFRNADVLLYLPKTETLAVFELTLGGASSLHDRLISGKFSSFHEIRKGIGVEVNYWQNEFLSFVEEFVSYSESLEAKIYFTEEIIKALQSYSYVLSFLLERKEKVSEILVRVLYPHREGFRQRFKIRENYKDFIEKSNLYERTVNLYKSFKDKAKRKPYRTAYWKERVKEFTGKTYVIPESRRIGDVRNSVKENVFSTKEGELLLLLHPPGTGKTRAVIEKFLSLKSPALLFLFTPRRVIVEDKRRKLEKDSVVIEDTKDYSRARGISGFLKREKSSGRLKLISQRFTKELARRRKDKYAIVTTTQALVEVSKGKSTVKYFRETVERFFSFYPEGRLIVAVDELLGDEGSIPALKEIIEVLNTPDSFIGFKPIDKSFIYGLDANLINGEVAEKLFFNLKREGWCPPLLIKAKGESSYQERKEVKSASEYFGIKTTVSTQPTFPCKERVKTRTIFLPWAKKESLIERICQILEENRKSYLYIQDKEMALSLKKILKAKGFSVALITSTIREEVENLGSKDFVISTSSASRGIDVPLKKAFIVLPNFGIEGQIAEVLQAVFRIRQEKEIEDKRIVFLTPYFSPSRDTEKELKEILGGIEDITEIESAEKRELFTAWSLAVAYKVAKLTNSLLELVVNPNPKKEYFVPIPAIRKRKGKGMELSAGLSLIEVLKDREIERENILVDYKLLHEREPKVEYPYRYSKALASIEFKDLSGIKKFYAIVKKDITLPDGIKNELLKFLKVLIEEKSTKTVYDETVVAELLFFSPYSDLLEEGTEFVINGSKTVGRKSLSSIRGAIRIKDGRVFIPLAETTTEKQGFYFPKVPIEMLMI